MNSDLLNSASGIYAYCLTLPISSPSAIMGIDNKHAVYLAEREGICAAISNVSLLEFSKDILDINMTNMAWLAPLAKRHEEIIEAVMALTPVAPLRFCTIYTNQDTLFEAVRAHREKVINFLNYAVDKAEWSLKVFCDKAIFMDASEKKRSPRQTSLMPGEAYLLAKKMRKAQEETFKSDLQTNLEDIDFMLSRYAERRRFLRCTDKGIHGKPLDMVLNTAFLIEQHTFDLFRNCIGILVEKYKHAGLVFEFNGPWPPYNFCPDLNAAT